MKPRAFTLIELLVVIAIIAILAAILFPVFSSAKEAAKVSSALAQMRQLSIGVMMYADTHDDQFPPATNYGVPADSPSRIWSPIVLPYVGNKDIFAAPGTDGKFSEGWSTRGSQSVGYSGATAYDPLGCTGSEADTSGCEGFTSTANFSQAEESSRVGLFAVTPSGPVEQKYRGYVFSPYNGVVHATDKKLSPPLISDRDLVKELQNLSPAQLKPVLAPYRKTGRNDGLTPIVFADGHVKTYSAKAILGMGTGIIWRFR